MQDLNRRDFLKSGVASFACTPVIDIWKRGSLVIDPNDPVAMSAPVQWAAKVLSAARYDSVAAAPANSLCIVAAGRPAPDAAESMSLSMSLFMLGNEKGCVKNGFVITPAFGMLRVGKP